MHFVIFESELSINLELEEQKCAQVILETVPKVTHFIRTEARIVSGLSISQFRILARLSSSSTTLTELADRQGISLPSMSKTINVLVQRGLVHRSKENHLDRRRVLLSLSQEGHICFEKIADKIRKQIENKIRLFSAVEKQNVKESFYLLAKVF